MAENEVIESGSNGESGVDYIEAIKELKQNTVAKADYEKLRSENQQLLKSLVNGETIAVETKKADVGEIRKELFTTECDLNNLDYVTKALELRDAIIEAGGQDPFLPWGKHIAPTQEDVETADRVAAVLKECVDYAEGDSNVFTNELQRRTIDTAPVKGKRK